MSNKKRRNQKAGDSVQSEVSAENSTAASSSTSSTNKIGIFTYLRTHLWMVGMILFLTLGALGAGLKYLDDDAQREMSKRANKSNLNNREESVLNKINPFLSAPPPPTPLPLSKEYIYSGSRLLAIEDANANAAPPADLAIWRPGSGVWWVMAGNGSAQVSVGWGMVGDDPAEGDYDGDGKTDFAVYRPATSSTSGIWWIMRSSDNSYYSIPLGGIVGTETDKAAQADYDGDGKTDIAVWRPSTGIWYIQNSSTLQTVQGQFGQSGDQPAPADYDGDGKADVAVWRDSETKFYSRNSSNGVVQTPPALGQGGEPVVGDYDGDGKANFAIKNGSNWLIVNTALQAQTTVWQQAGDKPVHNDYDGDGKVDIAVWRPSNGTWYIKNSSDGSTRTVQWGMVDDIPVPAFYKR